MGIKFLCPNGHKLHVKVFLSGKRAICPKCGARVIVPVADPAMVGGKTESTDRPAGVGEQSIEIALDESTAPDSREPLNTARATLVDMADTQPPAPPAGALDEVPDAMWYVRPVGGGQFGPAPAEIMRGWLAEGRVGANALVWRAGWTEWRNAAATFPQLGPQMPPPETPGGYAAPAPANGMPPLPVAHAVQNAVPSPPEVDSPSVPPLAQAALKRRRKKDQRLIASAILVAVSLILVIVLVLVSRPTGEQSDKKIEEPPAADEETLI